MDLYLVFCIYVRVVSLVFIVGIFLTLLPALETLFLLLVYLVLPQYEGFCLVLLYPAFFYLVSCSLLCEKERVGMDLGKRKSGETWEE